MASPIEDASTETGDAQTFPTSRLPTGSTAPANTAPNSAKTYKVGDKVAYADGSSIQLYSYEQPVPPPRFQNPDPGTEFGLIDVQFCARERESLIAGTHFPHPGARSNWRTRVR
jgi:hypothetical protein